MKDVILNSNPPISDRQSDYVFISYSHKDRDAVYEDLWRIHDRGFSFWYDDALLAGEVWCERVAEVIKDPKCRLAVFFVSENSISSAAIRQEMELVRSAGKSFFTVNITDDEIPILLARAITEKRLRLADMALYTEFFDEDIIYVKRSDPDYVNTLARHCIKHGLKASVEVVNVRNMTRKVLIVCKNSSFSNSIISGIYDFLSKKDNVIVDKRLVDKRLSRLDLSLEFNRIITDNMNEYDGFILRVPEKYNDSLLETLKTLERMGKRVVLLDIELDARVLKDMALSPSYVGGDFITGGALLGERIGDVAKKFGLSDTRVVLFEGPYANHSAKIRCESLYNTLLCTAPTAKIHRYNLPSLTTSTAIGYVRTQAEAWEREHLFNHKTVILFAGIDNIAEEIMRTVTRNDEYDVLNRTLRSAKKLVIVGYDGIRDQNNEIILKNYGIDFLTIDVVPFKQGVDAGKKIYSLLFEHIGDDRTLTQPELIEYIKFNTEKFDNARDIQFLLNNKKAFIFDLDGTIADTEPFHWEAYNMLLEPMGVHLDNPHIKRYVGHAEADIYKMIKADFSIDFDEGDFFERRIEMYLELVVKKGLKPHPFIYEILEDTSARSCIVSSQYPTVVDTLLALWKLDKYFPKDMRFCCHDGRYNKRQIYENIGSYMGFDYPIAPSNVVLFEDSLHHIIEAQKLGIITVGVEHRYNRNTLKRCNAIMVPSVTRGVFIGLCGLDAIYYGKGGMPEENTKGKYTDYTLEVGGPAANAAITFSRLGGEAYLVTALGDSDEATLIKSKLKDASVKVIDLSAGASEMRCGVSFIYVNKENGSRTIFSGQNSSPIVTNPDFEEYVKRASFVLYDGNLPVAEQKMIQYVEYHDKDLIIDAGSYKSGFAECFYRSTAVISSETFLDPSGCDVFTLRSKYGFKYAAMSRGADSILYDTGDKKGEIVLKKVEVEDTLGAGDILHGAYCYFRYVKKYSFRQALTAAGDIASLSVECRTVNGGLDHAISIMSNQLDTDDYFKVENE